MPIVDGLTSAKMIRSYEKTHPDTPLSARARLNGRIPIFAVSASLVEKDLNIYTEAGFDAWILKPISFHRLSELLRGTVDAETREKCLYQPGHWEQGGWFNRAQELPKTHLGPDPSKPVGTNESEGPGGGVQDPETDEAPAAEPPAENEEVP
jgi:hypothetical protein